MADADPNDISPKKPRRPRRPARVELPDTSDPVEIAMKAVATGADRHGSAQAVLEKHARLIDIQCEREREEWHVLRVQRMTRWLIMAAVLGLLLGLAALIWGARTSTSLVIEPFGVPPSLAQRGLTGRVVSARVLDRLAQLQRQTESMRGEKTYANDWQDDIKIAIPETGVSIGDAWRTLKGWLGEETRIGGEVVLAEPGTISITTRAGPLAGGTVTGPEAEFDRLVDEAAAGIYRVTQPYRYAISRPADSAAEREQVLTELAADPAENERKWALSGLSAHYRMIGDYPRSADFARRALEIDPKLVPAIGNVALAESFLGHDEKVLGAIGDFTAEWRRLPDDYDARIVDFNGYMFETEKAQRLGSAQDMREAARKLAALGLAGTLVTAEATRANAALLAHDYPAAMAASRSLAAMPGGAGAAAILSARIRFHQAIEQRHAARARAAAAEVLAATEAGVEGLPPGARDAQLRIFRRPELAIGLGKIGLGADARRLADGLPEDCYECVRAKGWAALASGNRPEALRWFREAVRQAPSMPMAYADLGHLSLLQRDRAAALARFEEARRRGPDWADGHKYSADILAAEGRATDAVSRYREAAERAPRWGRLQLDLGALLRRLGRADEAHPHLAAASSADLSQASRARLAALLKN